MFIVFQLAVLLFSVVIHEVTHGYVAERLGDPTARLAGRLTLNPLKHLDPFGSVILPVILYLASGGGFVFGWAKPVPYNPLNLKDPEKGAAIIAGSGPLSNLGIAIAASGLYHLAFAAPQLPYSFANLLSIIVIINVVLAVFNLVPIPPLDGSKILFSLLPDSAFRFKEFLARYGMFILLFFIFFGFRTIVPVISFIADILL